MAVTVPEQTVVETTDPNADPPYGRNAAIGAVVGFLFFGGAVVLACLTCGLGLVDALGPGVFAGLWGGVGFGFMMGGTLVLSRHLDG